MFKLRSATRHKKKTSDKYYVLCRKVQDSREKNNLKVLWSKSTELKGRNVFLRMLVYAVLRARREINPGAWNRPQIGRERDRGKRWYKIDMDTCLFLPTIISTT